MNEAAMLLFNHIDFRFSKVNTDVNTFDCTWSQLETKQQ
jgi:hypothetical protein